MPRTVEMGNHPSDEKEAKERGARVPAKSLDMQENSLYRKWCRVEHLVLDISRLMSSKSTEAGWCLTSWDSESRQSESASTLQIIPAENSKHLSGLLA
jgi:hypothetical protein